MYFKIMSMFLIEHNASVLTHWGLTQYSQRFPDGISKSIFLKENAQISFKISLKFVPKQPNTNIQALVRILAWRWSGDKPLSQPIMAYFDDTYMRRSDSMR